ncbi:MAG: serine/threonine protein kinase [Gammaproteobacteria bacterium]|nr:serine/threonine protein kinase [Gammaproteobacteria bacterium]
MDIPGYAIKGPIAQGGMATTFLATQQSLQREVALKVLDLHAVAKPIFAERFLNEGRLVAGLRHPHIITIFDVGTAGSHAYIAMEYVAGGDLKSRIEQGTIPAPEALAITEQIAAGLAAAHQRGIIHRDVKPGNVLFRTDGSVVLTDFGIAKQLSSDANLTSAGTFIGSPNYMSPEQADGAAIDARSDLYSLGVVLYEMLTGEKPYLADSVVDVILKHKREPIPRLPEALVRYQELLDLMLAKRPDDLFRDADSLLHYLRRLRAADDRGAGEALTMRSTRVRVAGGHHLARRTMLTLVLLVLALGYKMLDVNIDRLNAPRLPILAEQASRLEAIAPAPTESADDAPNREQVVTALRWLARRSLDEYRLTAPPGDNAYYYYSRLRQLTPDPAEALAGFQEIANRLSHLAEQALARGDRARAQAYLELGLQIDANNAALRALQPLLHSGDRDLLAIVREWLR